MNTATAAALGREEDSPLLELPALPYDPVTPIDILDQAVESAFRAYVASSHVSAQS